MYVCTCNYKEWSCISLASTCTYSGLPSSPPDDIVVTPLSSTSFAVNWIISNPEYSFIVTWTNIHTGLAEGSTALPENTNSYTVTGLNNSTDYNVSLIAVGVCGMMTSGPITVYGEYTSCNAYVYACTYAQYVCTYMYTSICMRMYK